MIQLLTILRCRRSRRSESPRGHNSEETEPNVL